MRPSVSVIVAAYNAEKWLPRCLDSLRAQTLENIEVIVVDDGSTDSTGRIADEYANLDNRIKVIHQPNCGVSITKQVGIDNSTGDYFIFLDSDDYARPDAYQTIYDCAVKNKAAIACSNYYRVEPSGTRAVNDMEPRYTITSKLKEVIFRQNGYLMRHLIARDLPLRYGIQFPSGMSFGEDLFFLIQILTSCRAQGESIRITTCKENLFYYDKTANPQSLTSLIPPKRFWSRFHWWESIYNEIPLDEIDKPAFYARLVDDTFCVLWNNSIPSDELCSALKPYSANIRKYTPFCPQKYLVLLLCKGEYEKARKWKYVGSFRILRDKMDQWFTR